MFLTNHGSGFLLHDVRVVKNVACLSSLTSEQRYIRVNILLGNLAVLQLSLSPF